MKNQNLFLENCLPEKSNFLYYLIGSLIIIIFNLIGQIPLFYYVSKSVSSEHVNTGTLDILNSLDSNLAYFLILFPFLIAFLGFIFVIKKLHRQSFKSVTTSRSKIDIKRIIFSFLYWTTLSSIIFFSDLIISPDNFELNFKVFPFLIMLIISIIFIPFQSALEEYIFRGYLMQGFSKMFNNRWMPLILTSFIFGSLHYFNPEVDKLGPGLIIYYIGTGFFFGIITLMDEGIELSIGLHVANNLMTAILVTAEWTSFQTESIFKDVSEPSLGVELVVFLFIVYPLTMYIFSKKFNWFNWRNKIFS